jgi:carboxymethylenebutenolidase
MGLLTAGPRDVTIGRVSFVADDGTTVDAVHASPRGAPIGGVVVHPDVLGLRPLFDELAGRLASHGLAVAVPDPYARCAPAVRAAADPSPRRAAFAGLDDTLQLGDLARAADVLAELDHTPSVFVLGFCLGGMQCLKAAAGGRFARAVAFYGGVRVPPEWPPGKLRDPLATASSVCPTLAIFGGLDPSIPPDDVAALQKAWSGRPDCEIVVYPEAGHSFAHVPDYTAHRPGDAADAWHRTLKFLGVAVDAPGGLSRQKANR